MLKLISDVVDLLDGSQTTGEAVASWLRAFDADVDVLPMIGDAGLTDLVRVVSPGTEGVRARGPAPTTLKDQRARQATLEEELGRANRRLMTLQGKGLEYDRLDQELRMRRDTYDLYVKREQEARLSNAMDEQKLVNVDVVQRPALPLPRADTQGASIALLVVVGLVLAIAAAFAREYMTRSLRTEYDVGRHLGLPLLGSIGDVLRA